MTSSSTSETKLDRMREAYRGMGFLQLVIIGGRTASAPEQSFSRSSGDHMMH